MYNTRPSYPYVTQLLEVGGKDCDVAWTITLLKQVHGKAHHHTHLMPMPYTIREHMHKNQHGQPIVGCRLSPHFIISSIPHLFVLLI